MVVGPPLRASHLGNLLLAYDGRKSAFVAGSIDGGCLVKLAFRPLDNRKIDGEEVQLTLLDLRPPNPNAFKHSDLVSDRRRRGATDTFVLSSLKHRYNVWRCHEERNPNW
ncbi:hypothetical protein HanIR_Chr05g0242461 [Helianthus annuus]|nr:hypothetical protein HanIR_Chr05g0242461 [Helianthus annuus]